MSAVPRPAAARGRRVVVARALALARSQLAHVPAQQRLLAVEPVGVGLPRLGAVAAREAREYPPMSWYARASAARARLAASGDARASGSAAARRRRAERGRAGVAQQVARDARDERLELVRLRAAHEADPLVRAHEPRAVAVEHGPERAQVRLRDVARGHLQHPPPDRARLAPRARARARVGARSSRARRA